MTTCRRFATGLIGGAALAAALGVALEDARAADPNTGRFFIVLKPRSEGAEKYPEMGGTWARLGRGGSSGAWDPTKPPGLGQQAPLTAEYQAVLEANLAERAQGGTEYNPAISCLPAGMPRIMIAYDPLEFIVTPEITYIRSDHLTEMRRIYTDGRSWPATITPTFAGYSIGQWVGQGSDGRYQELDVETRGFKGPRALDVNGLPVHRDNQSIIKERLFLDPGNRNLLHDEVTTIDHAYTRPWTVIRDYGRELHPIWVENNCTVENHYVTIGAQAYFISADGHLMPTKKNQPAPDLRNFERGFTSPRRGEVGSRSDPGEGDRSPR